MVGHAFEVLGLHRIGLSVFAFNERAIRSYRSVGFVVEGRAREAIWREGRWWDEISMSLLADDWAALRSEAKAGRADPDETEPSGARRGRSGSMAGLFGRRR